MNQEQIQINWQLLEKLIKVGEVKFMNNKPIKKGIILKVIWETNIKKKV